ncbi:uncharacterized protein [Diadema setosum]|uniref:uncharacterized protein n=1 Tax=Diadema setosum TaxID=31175 RepID=UPI003B3A3730
MAGPLPTPTFDWDCPDKAQAFKEFKQLSQMWFNVKGIKKEDQYNYMIIWSGRDGLRVFNTWNLTEEQVKDPQNIWSRLESHIQPTENFRVHRLEFQRYRQLNNEAIDDFVVRCKSKVAKCLFRDEDIQEERIIEVLISGVQYPEVQKMLLAKGKMTLKEALDIARTHEASTAHMSQLRGLENNANVHTAQKSRTCPNCGTIHPKGKCPAYSSTCHNCGKKGRWKKMCRSKSSSRGKNYDRRGPSKQKSQFHQKGWNKRKGTHGNKAVHPLEMTSDDEHLTSEFNSLKLETLTFNRDLLFDSLTADVRDEVFATLAVDIPNRRGDHTLKVKVDTGAQGNILPTRIFKQIHPEWTDGDDTARKPLISRSSTRLLAYNGAEIPQHGTVILSCRYKNGQWHKTTFFVVDTTGTALLGLPSSREMELVTLNCAVQASTQAPVRNTKDLQTRYPDRFEGIGKFPGEFHIDLKDDAQPVIHSPRRLPIHLKEELQGELNRMEELGVIRKVTEPTDWVSSIALSRKSNGKLRVCLDPKDLNRACRRTHHKTPTLEEITFKMSGAKVFSKLDARHGYWSIVLDNESSLLTTFNSPLGRYCFKRLPFGLNVSQDIFQAKMDVILEGCRCHRNR